MIEEAHKSALQLIQAAADAGIRIRVTEGYRSPERQNELYAQGRTTPGKRVTNATGGKSVHQSGRAFDVVVLNEDGKPDWESPHWDKLGELGRSMGLRWGGDFKSIVDKPHFEWQQPKRG